MSRSSLAQAKQTLIPAQCLHIDDKASLSPLPCPFASNIRTTRESLETISLIFTCSEHADFMFFSM